MNKITSVQAEKLIELIKEKPLIYNRADKYYKHVSMKVKIWQEIAENIGASENDCKIAWKSLRDQFVKAEKEMNENSGQDAAGKKIYKYYEQLLFLKDSVQTRKKTCNDDHWTDEPEIMDSDVKEIFSLVKEEYSLPDDEYDPFVSMNEVVIPSTSANTRSSPTSSISPRPSKIFKGNAKEDDCLKLLEEVLTKIKTPNSQSQGENDKFFSSLATMMDRANLTAVQTRQIHRKLFNLVADELDEIESNQ